ncbi:NADPH-dependent 2,4-dienoyl-CoA reductase/sulfur reductase-like enzyme [Methylobacterium sp. BE186]|uniref:FCSD flavin-binding domain-containing protein n=1 Tax=Methylobacterium sp. BE186 TaxID=2817715 RepID=UPI00286540F7|nr:FCSD flavin-binding domain-containing protein [Methylobacterium sp. BE186]MDR7039132.1 NADPH-dependent 2,4-dienoyl-CoA reductase/sulfur reductase-like enzyme [Methylobacterium sp. BE186]
MTATRRTVLGGLSALATAPALGGARPDVVVVGGGFGGATAARALCRLGLGVTLVEPARTYHACPLSNAVLVGLRPMASQVFGYGALAAAGIRVVHDRAVAIDGSARRVRLAGGGSLAYDRLIVSPGIEIRLDAIPGYDASASEMMPHAWKAGPQTETLARRLAAMEDGGLVVLTVPDNPYRCPPGPYERASLIADYLKARKPRSKLILLDAKDVFSKQPLFEEAWATRYPQHLEYVPRAQGGRLAEVDASAMTLRAEAGTFRPSVASVIPPQRAPEICRAAGLTDAHGWCPVDPVSFESLRVSGVHVIGDAAMAGAMPKSAFSANDQAKVCAQAVADLLRGRAPAPPKLVNVCYSLVAPGRAVSIAGVYGIEWDTLVAIPEAAGISPVGAPENLRAQEAAHCEAWFEAVTAEMFG